jgi:predicted dehydrogenase
MYRDAAAWEYPKSTELVAMCDNNPGRLALSQRQLLEKKVKVPGYAPEDFEKAIREHRANLVIVTSRDCTHDDYIVRGLEAGCDVITEKPMTMTAEKCQRILDTIKKTGRKVRVTFNYRYSPVRTQVKEVIQEGAIGRILSVEFKWMLDTSHGADYFRRWHRNKVNSGGLMVHKAAHHFDLVNWWINSIPTRVGAIGARNFYTPAQGDRYGFTRRADRCLDCPEAKRCPFYMDLRGSALLRELYLDNEKHDGYHRDQCVFSGDIDIEDSMNVTVQYKSGVVMAYSLNAFSPWEGYHIVFNGTRGRLEHICRESSYVNGDGTIPGQLLEDSTMINVMPHFTSGYFIKPRTSVGGHGGGDQVLLDDLFSSTPLPDPLKRCADHRGGAYAILTGIAANISMKEKRMVEIDSLVTGLTAPDYPDEASWDRPIKLMEFISDYDVSDVIPNRGSIKTAKPPAARVKFTPMTVTGGGFMNVNPMIKRRDGLVYFKARHQSVKGGKAMLLFGADGPSRVWLNGKAVGLFPNLTNPAGADRCRVPVTLKKGANELLIALDTNEGKAWGVFSRFQE